MNTKIKLLVISAFLFVLAFAIFGQAIQDRTPVTVDPKCEKNDKGNCKAVKSRKIDC